jgi:hypothetical protein
MTFIHLVVVSPSKPTKSSIQIPCDFSEFLDVAEGAGRTRRDALTFVARSAQIEIPDLGADLTQVALAP